MYLKSVNLLILKLILDRNSFAKFLPQMLPYHIHCRSSELVSEGPDMLVSSFRSDMGDPMTLRIEPQRLL